MLKYEIPVNKGMGQDIAHVLRNAHIYMLYDIVLDAELKTRTDFAQNEIKQFVMIDIPNSEKDNNV